MHGDRFADVGVRQRDLAESNFTCWAVAALMIPVEELQNSNYCIESFETVTKQITIGNAGGTHKYHDTEAGDHATLGPNADDADSYGRTGGDQALPSRPAIPQYISKPPDLMGNSGGKKSVWPVTQTTQRGGASMYQYLRYEHASAPNFTP
jgi:hypothetical protein